MSLKLEELEDGLKQASNRRVGIKRALALRQAAEKSIGVKEGLEGAKVKLQACLEEIEFYQGQIKKTEEAMGQHLEATGLASYLLSIPGVGVVTAAGFLGEIGDPTKYQHWRQIQKLAGYNLTAQKSGQKQKAKTTISKRGRPGLRNLLYQASLILVARNKEFKVLYHYFLRRPENPLTKKQALVAVVLKLVRVMFTLVTQKKEYDASKVLGKYREEQLKKIA